MRYFLLLLALAVVTVMGVLGKRGDTFKKPPLEIFPDMDRQAKLRPQTPNLTFANGRSSQEPVANTVARGDHYENNAINTGRIPGSTNLSANFRNRTLEPASITSAPFTLFTRFVTRWVMNGGP